MLNFSLIQLSVCTILQFTLCIYFTFFILFNYSCPNLPPCSPMPNPPTHTSPTVNSQPIVHVHVLYTFKKFNLKQGPSVHHSVRGSEWQKRLRLKFTYLRVPPLVFVFMNLLFNCHPRFLISLLNTTLLGHQLSSEQQVCLFPIWLMVLETQQTISEEGRAHSGMAWSSVKVIIF